MKQSTVRLSVWITGLCVFFMTAATAAAADKKEVIQQARSSYYSLSSQGLVDFQCNLTPNWEALLQEARQSNPEGVDQAIKTLNQLVFTVTMRSNGSAKVTHTTVAASNDKMAQGLNQVYSGMEQMVTGFFETWTPFMVDSPFPKVDSEYQLDEQAGRWSLSYKEGNADRVTTMDKDFAIRELRVNSPEYISTLQPQFTKTPNGFLLTGYQAQYSGSSPSEATQLQVRIAYQQVNGLQLPQKLNLGGSYGGTRFQVEVTFSGCQVTRR